MKKIVALLLQIVFINLLANCQGKDLLYSENWKDASKIYCDNGSSLKLKITVNGELFDPYSALNYDDVIKLELTGRKKNVTYSFKEIKITVLVMRGRKKHDSQTQQQTQQSDVIYGHTDKKLEKYIGKHSDYSENPVITIPFKVFETPCLSRVRLQVYSLYEKAGGKEKEIPENQFYYQCDPYFTYSGFNANECDK